MTALYIIFIFIAGFVVGIVITHWVESIKLDAALDVLHVMAIKIKEQQKLLEHKTEQTE